MVTHSALSFVGVSGGEERSGLDRTHKDPIIPNDRQNPDVDFEGGGYSAGLSFERKLKARFRMLDFFEDNDVVGDSGEFHARLSDQTLHRNTE